VKWWTRIRIRFTHPKNKPLSLSNREASGQSMIVRANSPNMGRYIWRKYVRPALLDMEMNRYGVQFHEAFRRAEKVK
jgi:hypothetical protein